MENNNSQKNHIVNEGLALWKKQKEYERIRKIQEQQEAHQLLDYWPYSNGQIKPRRLKNLRLEGLFPDKDYKDASRYVGTLDLGRPGGGAPLVTSTGKMITRTRVDPLLRFQFGNQDLRRCVDNNLRYKTNKKNQEEYKKELDKLIEEKNKQKEKLKVEEQQLDQNQGWSSSPGSYNKKLTKQPIFYSCKSIYTGVKNRKLPPLSFDKDNGVELVPLIVNKRSLPVKIHLDSTDVTNEKKIANTPTLWSRQGSAYLRELNQQILLKQQKLKATKSAEIETVCKHFITLESFWGRPGHGAPIPIVKKQRLDQLLFPGRIPIGVH